MVRFGNGPFWFWDETSGSENFRPFLTCYTNIRKSSFLFTVWHFIYFAIKVIKYRNPLLLMVKKMLWWCNDYIFIRVLASSVVDRGFEPKFDQAKNYVIGICCFSTKHEALRRKSKEWLTRNQDNVSVVGRLYVDPQTVVSVS